MPNKTSRTEKQMGFCNSTKGHFDISAIVKPKIDEMYKGYEAPCEFTRGFTDDGHYFTTNTSKVVYETMSTNYCEINDLPYMIEIGFYVNEYYL
ncbi:hypothetical protein RLOatenuis_6570 [Rickettsiales bacterium]|nr:hypothetical protein RLOatenuis_6570 [Rickettsiales bacterium]